MCANSTPNFTIATDDNSTPNFSNNNNNNNNQHYPNRQNHRNRITDQSGTTSSFSSESGVEGTGDGTRAFVPEVLRYATSMRLTFKIRDGEPESIYPPVLEVGGVWLK